MKRSLVVFAIVAAASAAAIAQYAPGRMELTEFKKLHADGKVVVIDVRDAQSFANGHIPRAYSIPLGSEARHVAMLKGEKRPIVAYCA